MEFKDIIARLKREANPDSLAGMAKYGITPERAYGIRIPVLRKMAREIGHDHQLAARLWEDNIRETRILASMVDELDKVSERQMDSWVKDFDYWEICDQCVMNLFEKTEFAFLKAVEWSKSKEEYIKRAGFVMMARLAVSNKNAADKKFEDLFTYIKSEATDDRVIVKKAVNWALRQIGKRNLNLHKEALRLAREIKQIDSPAARWIANDAIKELTNRKIISRIKKTRTDDS